MPVDQEEAGETLVQDYIGRDVAGGVLPGCWVGARVSGSTLARGGEGSRLATTRGPKTRRLTMDACWRCSRLS